MYGALYDEQSMSVAQHIFLSMEIPSPTLYSTFDLLIFMGSGTVEKCVSDNVPKWLSQKVMIVTVI